MRAAEMPSVAGQYVSSIFDLAHNMSRRTSFVSSRPQSRLVRASWNKRSGGKDPYGKDDGTAKIDRAKVKRDDAAAVSWWKDDIAKRACFGGSRVLVTGAGPVGLMGALMATQRGFEVHVSLPPAATGSPAGWRVRRRSAASAG